MLAEIMLAAIGGIIAGCFTGLVPGVHVNLVSIILLGLSGFFLEFTEPVVLAVFIISMAVTHTILDAVPTIFLGAPDSDQVLNVLPGHRMLLNGDGYGAVRLTVVGSLGGLWLAVLLTYPVVLFIEKIFPFLQRYMAYFLIFIVILLIFRDKERVWALALFFISGVLGLGVFGLNMKDPLLPLLSGLFGTSSLVLSIVNKIKLPKQRFRRLKVNNNILFKAIGSSVFAGGLVSLLPGVGSAQASIIASQIAGKIGDRGFLILVGGVNTVNFVLSFVSLFVLNKARNGAIVVVSKLLEVLTLQNFILFIGVSLFVGGISAILALSLSRIFSKQIVKIKYSVLCFSIILFITLLVFIFSSWLGLLILLVSTMVGLIPPLVNCGRNHLMGCLILPVILFFLL